MLEGEEIQWLQAAVNDLNNLIQVADESAHLLEPLCGQEPDAKKYFEFLRTSLARAATVTHQLAQRIEGQPVDPKPTPNRAASEAEAIAGGIEIANAQSPRELILIIDDEPMITMLASEMLTDAGYRVVSAMEPFRALEIVRKIADQIDLVILDFTLPIMDGSEVFEELQRIRPDIAVMLSSGFAEQATLRAMLVRGLRGFLPKPYREEKLLTQVRSTLDAIRAERTGERRVM